MGEVSFLSYGNILYRVQILSSNQDKKVMDAQARISLSYSFGRLPL